MKDFIGGSEFIVWINEGGGASVIRWDNGVYWDGGIGWE